ncbi:MAG: hypothetical protein JW874_05970 [Spirochaetales bacterium]|nr:hypothetical protein [Spirochaetales bacterium]
MKSSEFVPLILLLCCLLSCASPETGPGPQADIEGAKLPPTDSVMREYPKLMNYFHCWWLDGVNTEQLSERLAQWDIIILDPDGLRAGKYPGLSFSRIRELNPDIIILGWIPVGQSPVQFSELDDDLWDRISNSIDDYTARTAGGDPIEPQWGGYIMNPYKNSHIWPQAVIDHLSEFYFGSGDYTFDGMMFDILAENAPTFASPDSPPTIDVDENGIFDASDHLAWQEGVNYLLDTLRTDFPDKILTGNGGVPWSSSCSYFTGANGCMHENALGNEFGDPSWTTLWEAYNANMDPAAGTSPERIHLMPVDLRYDRTQDAAENSTALSADDLRRMRLGLGTSLLLDGGYFGFDRGDCLHGQLWWFDEYDADLGSPSGPHQQDVYGTGSYSREFANGTVIVNTGSTELSVTLTETSLNTSTGESGTDFVILADDAAIFSRLQAE